MKIVGMIFAYLDFFRLFRLLRRAASGLFHGRRRIGGEEIPRDSNRSRGSVPAPAYQLAVVPVLFIEEELVDAGAGHPESRGCFGDGAEKILHAGSIPTCLSSGKHRNRSLLKSIAQNTVQGPGSLSFRVMHHTGPGSARHPGKSPTPLAICTQGRAPLLL